uniref:Testis-expressed sequence 9 protein n=1 Tax=Schistocephalus solidus TaxID=70667 RepID=A0A0V0J7D0_SCHSO
MNPVVAPSLDREKEYRSLNEELKQKSDRLIKEANEIIVCFCTGCFLTISVFVEFSQAKYRSSNKRKAISASTGSSPASNEFARFGGQWRRWRQCSCCCFHGGGGGGSRTGACEEAGHAGQNTLLSCKGSCSGGGQRETAC